VNSSRGTQGGRRDQRAVAGEVILQQPHAGTQRIRTTISTHGERGR
jgi:hypothetical protein